MKRNSLITDLFFFLHMKTVQLLLKKHEWILRSCTYLYIASRANTRNILLVIQRTLRLDLSLDTVDFSIVWTFSSRWQFFNAKARLEIVIVRYSSTMMDPQAEGRNDTLRRQTVTDTPETLLTQKEMYGQSKESGPTVTFEFYTAGTCSSVSSFRCHVAPGEELATSSPILRNSAATRTLENRGAEILHRECSRSEGMSYR